MGGTEIFCGKFPFFFNLLNCLFFKIKHVTFWNSRVDQCDFILFFQISNIENFNKNFNQKKKPN
jgi:hypothetical protein